jgi:23S rRNA pseudouridine955/2504/2580 synthase
MGARREFTIDADWADGRLETFLRSKLGLPRTLALKAIRKGWVRIDGKRARVDARVPSGARVAITNPALVLPAIEGERLPARPVSAGPVAPESASPHARPRPAASRPGVRPRREGRPAGPSVARPVIPPALVERARASVRRIDDDVIVSSKPAGAVVHAGSGHGAGWVDALAAAFDGEATPIGRLDRDTSGLLLIARRRAATRALFQALREGRVARSYVALAYGQFDADEGTIDLPLAKLETDEGEQVVADAGGREARTRWRVIERARSATLLRVEIDTGRTHQIRAHLAAIGHPILGDPRHGGREGEAGATARAIGLERLFLHAGRLEYPSPSMGEKVVVDDPLPPELARLRDRFRSS